MCVEQWDGRRAGVDQYKSAVWLEHASNFAKRVRNVGPMVRAVARANGIESRVFEWKFSDTALLRSDVWEVSPLRFATHYVEHLGRKVERDDGAHARSDGEGQVARAAAEIEHVRIARVAELLRDHGEIGALAVHRARKIGGCDAAELLLNFSGVAGHSCGPIAFPCWLRLLSTP